MVKLLDAKCYVALLKRGKGSKVVPHFAAVAEKISADLVSKEFSIADSFLSEEELDLLLSEFDGLMQTGRFHEAGVGKNASGASLNSEIRRDQTCWFEEGNLLPTQQLIWARLEQLKQVLNQQLFLGLWSIEGHFALYPPGAYYRRHLDRFRNDDARTVTVVLYLNKNWRPEDGGQLRIYPTTGEQTIEPLGGRLVCFLSDRIEHEVIESQSPRRSFAGWFRRRIQAGPPVG